MITHRMVLLAVGPALSALAVATADAQARPVSAKDSTAAAAEPPTVLPTIIGVRRKAAKRPSAASSPIPYPTTITAAGPVFSTAGGQRYIDAAPAPMPASVIIDDLPFGVPFYWRDGWRNSWRERLDHDPRRQDGWRERRRTTPTSGAPRTAPVPIGVLAPRRR